MATALELDLQKLKAQAFHRVEWTVNCFRNE